MITSLSNLRIALSNSDSQSGKEMEIDDKLWNRIPLPNTVAPSFDTCNLSRTYELEIRVGLSYGSPGSIKVSCQTERQLDMLTNNNQPELTVQPLRMPVAIYSGIAPPPALLAAMAGLPQPQPQAQPEPVPPPFGQRPSSNHFSPDTSPGLSLGQYGPPAPSDIPSEAPPSYEDAMAEHMAPVDGPRREYQQPESRETVGDEKRNGGFRNEERLFP